jgi:hypothetical protein
MSVFFLTVHYLQRELGFGGVEPEHAGSASGLLQTATGIRSGRKAAPVVG